MTEVILNNSKILLYTSIKELPIDQSKKMQNYLLQAAGIGSTIADVDDHLARISTFLASDKKDECIEEVKNLRFAMFSALNEIRYDTPAFACMIHSVNGNRVEDYTSDGLSMLVSDLSTKGLSNELVSQVLEEVKKNLIPNVDFTSRSSSQMI